MAHDRPTHVVTGANSGIGKAITIELARQGHRVTMVCRSPARGEAAQQAIVQQTSNQSITLITGDLSTSNGVREVAGQLLAQSSRIAALINNAGVWQSRCQHNPDGIETSFAVNHLAPFLLTHLLLPALKANAPARIINVNAGLYVRGQIDLDRLPTGEDFHPIRTYCNTKLCNILFTRQLAVRLAGTGVTVNAIHPGVIRTRLGSSVPVWMKPLIWLAKRFWKTPEHGAQGPVYLATSDEVAGVSGAYFDEMTQMPYHPVALDDALAKQVWTLSETLTGLPAT